jgi:signal transduction histidine kinase
MPEIAAIIHDLRNPLSTILGGAEIMIASRLTEKQLRRIARNVYGASMRTEELLEEFLSRYRGTQTLRETVDLLDLVDAAVDRVSLAADSQSVAITRDACSAVAIRVDRKRIERVLINLLVNALEMMPEGGGICISLLLHSRFVLVKVNDTGPGIPPEIGSRLFQPFATAGKVKGLGLGLAFSRQAILDHGGEMWVEESKRGACFAFSLPLSL